LQWWEGELERAYVLHRARRVQQDTTTPQQARAAAVPAYLKARADKGRRLPSVHVQGWGSRKGPVTRGAAQGHVGEGGEQAEKEREAVVRFVVEGLATELYTELIAGFHMGR
jgi:hypothetical protein